VPLCQTLSAIAITSDTSRIGSLFRRVTCLG
jgi:hypothetical protein